jgi:hypothetical protein
MSQPVDYADYLNTDEYRATRRDRARRRGRLKDLAIIDDPHVCVGDRVLWRDCPGKRLRRLWWGRDEGRGAT